ncbi:S24/S26 family peptidase [Neobacillus sp. M.A.Huq-85]
MLIDNLTFTILKKTIDKNGWLELPAYGNSMYPFIRQGNHCRFVPCQPLSLKKGEVILFHSQDGKLIAHRFIRTKMINQQQHFLFKGDTNLGFDQPIGEERILGRLVSVKKQHLKLSPDHISAKLWGKFILAFPGMSGILRKYLNRKLNLQY